MSYLLKPSRPAPDPTGRHTDNHPNPERDAECSQRLALHTVNGLIFEVREFLDAALHRPLCGVDTIFDGVGRKGLEQPRFV